MRKLVARLLLVAGTSLPLTAGAITLESGPFFGGSWYGLFSQSAAEQWFGQTVGAFTFQRIDWVSGAQFEVPGLRNHNNGWIPGPGGTSTFASASGASSTSMLFSIYYQGSIQPASLRYSLYNGSQLRQAQLIEWTGSAWQFTDIDNWQPGLEAPVPEPTSLLLLGLALTGMGAASRRRRNNS